LQQRLLLKLLYLAYVRNPFLMQVLVQVPSPKQAELAEKYKRGIADALGIRPEDINEEVVEKWVVHWLRAIVKPESWEKYGLI